jgi:hypothetical protein
MGEAGAASVKFAAESRTLNYIARLVCSFYRIFFEASLIPAREREKKN